MINGKPSRAILAASLFGGLLLATTSLQAATYNVDASEADSFDGPLTVEGTFEYDDNGYTDWNLITTDSSGTFTYKPDNSSVVEDPITFINENPSDFVFSDTLVSSSDNLFLLSDGGVNWEALSLQFNEELGNSSVDVLPPNSLGSGFGNGNVLPSGNLVIFNGVPVSGTATVSGTSAAVPVPASIALLGAGLVGLGVAGRRYRNL